MNFSITSLKKDSPEIQELETWKTQNNSENLNKYLLYDGALSFSKFIENYITNKYCDAKALLFSINNISMGLIMLKTFTSTEDNINICAIDGICVNPEYLGHKVGYNMLKSIISSKNEYLKNIDIFIADLNKNNIASKKLFEKLNFKVELNENRYIATKINYTNLRNKE